MCLPQVMGVLDAMPASNMKPEAEDGVLEENRVYRTTYMFSATMPPPVERLARKYMRRPAVINIGSAGKATTNVTQKVRMMSKVPINFSLLAFFTFCLLAQANCWMFCYAEGIYVDLRVCTSRHHERLEQRTA